MADFLFKGLLLKPFLGKRRISMVKMSFP